MKNLPDKIYLNLGDLTKEEYNETDFQDLSEVTWSEDDVQGRNIKYVRTDAFVVKALKFLDENFFFDNKHCSIESGVFDSKEEMFDDFKKYMND